LVLLHIVFAREACAQESCACSCAQGSSRSRKDNDFRSLRIVIVIFQASYIFLFCVDHAGDVGYVVILVRGVLFAVPFSCDITR
jgi:hypothetical protein